MYGVSSLHNALELDGVNNQGIRKRPTRQRFTNTVIVKAIMTMILGVFFLRIDRLE